jgi:hypothetical protein
MMSRRSPQATGRQLIRRLLLGVAAASMLLAVAAGATPAFAEGPWWRLASNAVPSYLSPGGKGTIVVTASNVGDQEVKGFEAPVAITDKLPPGLKATAIEGNAGGKPGLAPLHCELKALRCNFAETGVLAPYTRLEVDITVEVEEPPGTVTSLPNEVKLEAAETFQCNPVEAKTGKFTDSLCTVKVSAGGQLGGNFERERPPSGKLLASPSVIQPLTVNGVDETPFGAEKLELKAEQEGGSPATEAGAHPFQLTTTLDMNQTLVSDPENGVHQGGPALVKDLRFKLPPGLIGNPNAVPQCSEVDFFAEGNGVNFCPGDTALGVATVTVYEPVTFKYDTLPVPVFNLPPAAGEPARFGFSVVHVSVVLDTSVRTGENYGVIVSVNNASQAAWVLGSEVTLWGVPGDKRHDQSRGWGCIDNGRDSVAAEEPCVPLGQQQPPPFLSLPTLCTGSGETTVEGESWPTRKEPKGYKLLAAPAFMDPLNGCGELPFNPSISVTPDQQTASTPTGLKVDVKVPQETTLSASGRAEADVKATTVALPPGVQASPAAAGGLLACSAALAGFNGFEKGLEENAQLENDHFSPEAAECPEASKVGTVNIKTPLLLHELTGALYLAAQDTNPFKSPLVLYLIAEDKVSGTRVKFAGEVRLNPETGQLVSTFENTPPLPFEDLKLQFFDGPRASQSTPPSCGTHTTTASFTPWSGGEAAGRESSFAITSGPNGAPCSAPQPFAPSFQAGTTNVKAGAFTPFTLTIGRPDGQQALKSISMKLPPGLAAMLASVTPCGEPQAAQGTCGPESLIGHSTSSSGLGPEPFTLPGQVFLTGPYKGAPFGLSSVTPAIAGPFNLGNIVVRSTINVDRNTGAATINTEEVPQIIKGVPSQIKQLNVTVERPGNAPFQFNPTNCNPMAITGTLTGWQGASEAVSYPFRAANCGELPFKPTLTAETEAQTSKADGASLTVRVTSAPGQANIGKTKVVFPEQLPSRLTTIQKACLAAVFEVNPASCPEGSVIGTATAHTPVLKSPLTGPAYLVSHGNVEFPDAEFVLQGEGITLVLDGKTNIHHGITSSTFESLPDAPVSTFVVTLPRGPHSAFAANGNLCAPTTTVTKRVRVTRRVHGRTIHQTKTVKQVVAQPLAMPTIITGQNGAVIEKSTPIVVNGCKAVKSFKKAKKAAKSKKKKHQAKKKK